MRDGMRSLGVVLGGLALVLTVTACNLYTDEPPSGCSDSQPAEPPVPPLVPATLAELSKGVNAIVAVDGNGSLTLTLNIGYDATRFDTGFNPSQCPQLSAVASVNGYVMRTGDSTPVLYPSNCGPVAYECAMPTFTLPANVDMSSRSLQFTLSDSSGVFDVDVRLPDVSLDGPSVLTPDKIAAVTVSPGGAIPTHVTIGAPELGIVFYDLTPAVIPTASGFSFVMPDLELTVMSQSNANPDWDAGSASCGSGAATLPCNAALEMTFDPIFDRCDFSACVVGEPASGENSGAASGAVLLPVVLGAPIANGAGDAGVDDAGATGD